MLETDYPHGDGTWPDTQAVVEKYWGHLPVDELRLITHRNAAEALPAPAARGLPALKRVAERLDAERGRVAEAEHDPAAHRVEDPVVRGDDDAEDDRRAGRGTAAPSTTCGGRVASSASADHVDHPTWRLGIAAYGLPNCALAVVGRAAVRVELGLGSAGRS